MKIKPSISAGYAGFSKMDGLGILIFEQKIIIEDGHLLSEHQLTSLALKVKEATEKIVSEFEVEGTSHREKQKHMNDMLEKIIKSTFN